MDSSTLLSPTDIHLIRRYVHTKYAPLPRERRAEIVADAIRRALQQRLPHLPTELKNQMTDKLISQCLVKEYREVIAEDVLKLCAELEVEEALHAEQITIPLLDWARIRVPGTSSLEQLVDRLGRMEGLTADPRIKRSGSLEAQAQAQARSKGPKGHRFSC